MRELDPENGGLEGVEPGVRPDDGVVILDSLAAVAQQAHLLGHSVVVRHHHAAIAICAEIFRRIEAERRRVSEQADAPALVSRPVRLRRVFDHHQVVPARQSGDRVEIGGLAVQVNGDNGPRSRRNRRRDRCRVEVVRLGTGIDEHGPRTRGQDSQDGGDKRVRDRDDFVARSDIVRPQGELDGVEAAGDADGMPGADVRGVLGLEALDGGSQNEVSVLADLADGGLDGSRERGVLNAQIDEWYSGRCDHFLIPSPR